MAHCIRAIFALLILVVLWACDKDSSSNINGPSSLDSIPYRAEAEDMALFYSGELHPPEYLVRKISHELWLMRDALRDSVRIPARTTFEPPWFNHFVIVLFDSVHTQLVLDSNHQQWNEVCEKYGLTVKRLFLTVPDAFLYAYPAVATHPVELAKLLFDEKISGVSYLSNSGRSRWADYGMSRSDSGHTVSYYMYDVIYPDLFGKYYFVRIEHNRARVIATHQNFPDNYEDILREKSSAYLDSVIDDMERNRPAWVDTARNQIGNVIYAPLFYWKAR